MIIDFSSEQQVRFDAQIAIIGSGAAGLSLAASLADTGLKIIVLESGGLAANGDANELSRGISSNPQFRLTTSRLRSIGGTTRLWSGACVPLDPIDFERRPWVSSSGWPIPFSDIAAYHARAETLLGISVDQNPLAEVQKPGSQDLEMRSAVYCPQRNFYKLFRRQLKSDNIAVLINATVVKIIPHTSGSSIETLHIADLKGNRSSVYAQYFVLCTGGIENARLLLASGLGNERDLVGRYFQDHPSRFVAEIETKNIWRVQKQFSYQLANRELICPRLCLSANRQRSQSVLNAFAHVVPICDEGTLPFAAKRFKQVLTSGLLASTKRENGRSPRSKPKGDAVRERVRSSVIERFDTSRFLIRIKRAAPSILFKASRLRLYVVSEQAPNRENRVMLSNSLDRLHVPVVKVKWNVGELEHRTVMRVVESLPAYFLKFGLGTVHINNHLDSIDYFAKESSDSYHHAGTTRMSDTPSSGVVDKDCRVHGIENLYVNGSSVMPTSGAANPTFTIIALALRLSDHLKNKFGLC